MKANVKLGFFCALVLAGLASCQREPGFEKNPTYDEKENTVKANFVLNVSTNTSDQTKTTAEYAQDNSRFLGMEAAHILSYELKYGDGKPKFFYTPSYMDGTNEVVVTSSRDFNLGDLMPAGYMDNGNHTRAVELMIPLGTNAMVMYAKAAKEQSSDLQGAVTTEGDPKNLGSLKFSLVPRLDSISRYNAGGIVFSRILNYFMAAGLVNEINTGGKGFWTTSTGEDDRSYGFWWPEDENTPTDAPDEGYDGYKSGAYTWHEGQLAWKQLGKMYEYKYDNFASTSTDDVIDGYPWTPLAETLGQAYYNIITIQVDKNDASKRELRAGAATSILRLTEDLYTIVDRVESAKPTSWGEKTAVLLAALIKSRIEEFFHITSSGFYYGPTTTGATTNNGRLTDAQLTAMMRRVALFGRTDEWVAKDMNRLINADYFTYETSSGYNDGFPANIGLPKGAAVLRTNTPAIVKSGQNTPDSFYYDPNIPAYGMGSATFPIANYRYPPEIMYFGNSEIRVSDSVMNEDDWPDDPEYWINPMKWDASWSVGAVSSFTRSVAMIRYVNYGTALLKSRVMMADGVTTLLDNNQGLHPSEQPNKVNPLPSGANRGLVITGIVIGGQPNSVCWDYTRASSDSLTVWKWVPTNDNNPNDSGYYTKYDGSPVEFENNGFDYMIYDKVFEQKVSSSTSSETTTAATTKPITVVPYNSSDLVPIYTMCWDNYDASKAEQNNVFFAVELRNETGADFWGELNLVRKGGTFYLVGELDLSKAAMATQKEALKEDIKKQLASYNYHYPPYNTETGESIAIPRVFMQDYMTIANIMLKADALQHAYVTMPDLRSSQISLGLSVDTSWRNGFTFNVNIGGTD